MSVLIQAAETWGIKLKKFSRISKRENTKEQKNQYGKCDSQRIFVSERESEQKDIIKEWEDNSSELKK